MKKDIVFYATLGLLILSFFLMSVSGSLAWFTQGVQQPLEVTGSSSSSYFGGGDGTEDHPYEINDPVHLYTRGSLISTQRAEIIIPRLQQR